MNRLITVTLGLAMLGATAAPAQTRIEAGETVSGSLTSRDSRMYNGAHFELWIYSGSRGERLFITLRSIQFDAYLLVQPFPGGRSPLLARDDDSGGGRDARVEFVLPEDGDYVITVTSAERGETGAYRLSVESDHRVASAATLGAVVSPVARALVPGRAVAGELRSGVRGSIGTSAGDWTFSGRAGETVTLDMRSSEFDAFLTLYSIDRRRAATRVAQDDNSGGGLNSRITFRVPADGEYVVRAERRYPGRSGSYTLTLRPSTLAARLGLRAEGDRTIAPNSAVSGELDDSDPKMHDGTPYELWTYVGRAGETIRITLRSNDFDAFVSIGTVTNGVFTAIESADDGAGGTNSRLDITLPFAGEYAIRANSLSPRRRTGDYILRISSLR
ncbi:MAG: PPC domain-containing protein [Gemmatimonadaceae bacterium]